MVDFLQCTVPSRYITYIYCIEYPEASEKCLFPLFLKNHGSVMKLYSG